MISSDKYQKNFHETLDEAIEDANKYLRPRSDYWVWKTDEGLFQWVAIPDPELPGAWDVAFIGRTRDLRPDWKARRKTDAQ